MSRIVASKEYWENLRRMGTICKKIRINKGVTQKVVAEETNTTVGYISSFEAGRCNSALVLDWYVRNGYRG